MERDIDKYLKRIPSAPGIYLMQDETGEILYVGKAKCLKDRVSSYFHASADHSSKIRLMVEKVVMIDYIETASEVEALVLEAEMILKLQPKYNTRQKDDKSYPYIVITKQAFPKVMIARKHDCRPRSKFKFYGPYIDAKGLRECFKWMQRIFRFRTCDLNIERVRERTYRPCLLASIHYCSAPCARRISHEAYKKDIQSLQKFLKGKTKTILRSLTKQMKDASKKWNFEEAARLRNQIQSIESLSKKSIDSEFIPGEFFDINPQKSLEELQKLLRLKFLPRTIEGIDIAHHSGLEAVGSLVCFVDAMPYPQGYRRYQIRTKDTQNDYAMLCEVLRRRFSGQDKSRPIPDLLIVDGGKGQLSSIMKEGEKLGIELPFILSLAKKNEEIFVPERSEPLNVQNDSSIHHLLCYVRDEAHRFAQRYHHTLKRKKIKRS